MGAIIYGKYKRPEKVMEKGGGELITEQAGYVPAEIQIMEFFKAGQRLNDYRKEQYDFNQQEEIDMSIEIPVRDPGFDMADASELLAISQVNLASQAEAARIRAEEAAKVSENPVGKPVE